MQSVDPIVLTGPDDLRLTCVACASPLPSAASGGGLCSICREPYTVGARGLADAAAIVELRRLIAARIDELGEALRHLKRAGRPPMWNLPLVAIHLFALYYQHFAPDGPTMEEGAGMSAHLGWDGPRAAPLYAYGPALREQRLVHALILWSVEVASAVYSGDSVKWMRRSTIVFAGLMVGLSLILGCAEQLPQLGWVPAVISGVVGLYITGLNLWRMRAREAAGPAGVRERLVREFSAVGLRCRGEQRRQDMERWLYARWAGERDREAFERREATMILCGGADAGGELSEAMLYVQGGMGCADIVLYLPMIDVKGALGEPGESAGAEATAFLADLRRRGWMVEEGRAGIHATRLVDEAELLSAAEWRTIAEDVRGLLELPAGRGRLSTAYGCALLARHGVRSL